VVWTDSTQVNGKNEVGELWGHAKSTLYAQKYNTWEEAWNATQVAGMMVCNMADIIQQTRNSWHNSAQLCIEGNGGLFEQLF
jgi:hypothetical protein